MQKIRAGWGDEMSRLWDPGGAILRIECEGLRWESGDNPSTGTLFLDRWDHIATLNFSIAFPKEIRRPEQRSDNTRNLDGACHVGFGRPGQGGESAGKLLAAGSRLRRMELFWELLVWENAISGIRGCMGGCYSVTSEQR